jgi:hypothetical protein
VKEGERGPHFVVRPEKLEVVGLREFLRITAPEVDGAVIESRLQEIKDKVLAGPSQGPLPLGIEPLSVFSPEDAAEVLEVFLQDTVGMNKRLRVAINKYHKGEF